MLTFIQKRATATYYILYIMRKYIIYRTANSYNINHQRSIFNIKRRGVNLQS